MIRSEVSVAKFCDNCQNFEPVATHNKYYLAEGPYNHQVIVSCKYMQHCNNLYKHMTSVVNKDSKCEVKDNEHSSHVDS